MKVTESYLLGIKEGREHLKNYPELKDDIQTMQTIASNASKLMRHHSGDMKELFKGERDFWRNQATRMTDAESYKATKKETGIC